MKLAQVVRNFIPAELAEKHATLMDDTLRVLPESALDDNQCPSSVSWYSLHTELLEDCCEKMEEITGLELTPTYDYCRIYPKGETLRRHSDRPSCQVSVTLNLRNKGGLWAFHWEGGSVEMEAGDAVVYRGCDVEHWREANPAEEVHQVFLHYVDANGEYADHGNEYLRQKPSHVHEALGTKMKKS